MAGKREPESEDPIEMGGVALTPGSRIGNYIFLREVGAGGMARVLLAKDPEDQLVALKVLRQNRFKTGLVRFRREFRALSRINHPNVIRVDAYGDLYGHPYIAMEYVDGPDLHTLIRSFREWALDKRFARVEEILVELCRALAVVHRRGLVHRDLKPSNVLLTREGTCKLTDFGIVKDLDPSADPNMSTTLVGTWAYASPEQISGAPIDHRSDLYSLGVILFAMLTGKRPFVAKDMAGYLEQHRNRPAPAPRDVFREVPAHLDEICRRLLQKEPRDRYQSAQEILYRLEAVERDADLAGFDGWQPPLVGRSLELEVIGDRVAALTRGEGSVVLLEGDDGSGRSRLLASALSRAEALGLPRDHFEFTGADTTFQVVLEWARNISHELGERAPPELLDALVNFARGDGQVRGDIRYALYDGVRDALRALLEDGPRVLALDDLHKASAREIEFFSALVRNLVVSDNLALLVIGSLRPKANPDADELAQGKGLGMEPDIIGVGPLSSEDLSQIVFGLLGDGLSSRLLARRLHRETEGNAYFVAEFLRTLLSNGIISELPDGTRALSLPAEEVATGHLEIPLGVRQMLRERLAGIAPADRPPLEVLAVGEREVELDVLLDVLDQDEEQVLDALDRLLAQGIIRERRAGDNILHSVSHTKFGDVVYRDLTPERRSILHRRMAAALEIHYAGNPQALEVVGEHYRKAGDAGRAYRYLVAAARRLADRSLSQEAWDLTEKAGALEESAMADLSPENFRSFRRDNLSVRASVLDNRADWNEAEKAYRKVLQLAEEDHDQRGTCEARLRLATVLRRRGQLEQSRGESERALEASRRLHFREGSAQALHNMAALAWAEGDLDECERMANEGLVVAQGAPLAAMRAELLLALTVVQATRGHLASATSGLTEAEGIFRELRRKRPRCLALANLAELLTWQGEPLEARQRARAALQVAEDLDYKLGLVVSVRAMAVAAFDFGLYGEARKGLLQAERLARAIQVREELLAVHVALTRLSVEMGDLTAARHHGASGLLVAEEKDPERYLALLQASLATAMAGTDPKDALALVQSAEMQLPELNIPRRAQVQLAVATAYYHLAKPEPARRHARAVLNTAGSRGFRLLLLEARCLMYRLTEGEEQDLHRTVAADLTRTFISTLSADLANAFLARPFLMGITSSATPS